MGLSGIFLKRKNKVIYREIFENVLQILDRLGWVYRYFKKTEELMVYESPHPTSDCKCLNMYFFTEEELRTDEGYMFQWMGKGEDLFRAITIDDISDCEDMVLAFALEYMKLYPDDIFYDELKWYYTKDDIDKMKKEFDPMTWCYIRPREMWPSVNLFFRWERHKNNKNEQAVRVGQGVGIPLGSTNIGGLMEAKVADYIRKNTDATLTDFENKITTLQGEMVGDFDIATKNHLIEVKASLAAVKTLQLEKFVVFTNENYINALNKEVVLYINGPIDMTEEKNIKRLNSIESMGVTVVNGLEELRKVLEL